MKLCQNCGTRFESSSWRCPKCNHHPEIIDGYVSFAPALAHDNSGFDAKHFRSLAPLEANNFWFINRNKLITWAMRKYSPHCETFLEIGCGTGYVLSGINVAFPNTTIFGSEIFCAGLNFAKNRVPNATLFQMDARDLPFEEHFDAIGAFDVLEHIDEDLDVLIELNKALKTDGTIIATVPQHPSLWSRADEHACHVRRYTSDEITRKFDAAGFTVIKSTSFISLLLPLLFASRKKIRDKEDWDPFTN